MSLTYKRYDLLKKVNHLVLSEPTCFFSIFELIKFECMLND